MVNPLYPKGAHELHLAQGGLLRRLQLMLLNSICFTSDLPGKVMLHHPSKRPIPLVLQSLVLRVNSGLNCSISHRTSRVFLHSMTMSSDCLMFRSSMKYVMGYLRPAMVLKVIGVSQNRKLSSHRKWVFISLFPLYWGNGKSKAGRLCRTKPFLIRSNVISISKK